MRYYFSVEGETEYWYLEEAISKLDYMPEKSICLMKSMSRGPWASDRYGRMSAGSSMLTLFSG